MFGYDDSLDVFGVHGVGSVVGMLMLGFLASPEVNPAIASTFKANGDGSRFRCSGRIAPVTINQFIGAWIATVALAAVARTFLIVKLVGNAVVVFPAGGPGEDESVGLDLSQHAGKRAYNE